MVTVKYYDSPLELIFLAADDTGLIGLWFEGQKYFAQTLTRNYRTGSTPILESAVRWLRGYFSGEKPSFTPPLHLIGTDCQIAVWKRLSRFLTEPPRRTPISENGWPRSGLASALLRRRWAA